MPTLRQSRFEIEGVGIEIDQRVVERIEGVEVGRIAAGCGVERRRVVGHGDMQRSAPARGRRRCAQGTLQDQYACSGSTGRQHGAATDAMRGFPLSHFPSPIAENRDATLHRFPPWKATLDQENILGSRVLPMGHVLLVGSASLRSIGDGRGGRAVAAARLGRHFRAGRAKTSFGASSSSRSLGQRRSPLQSPTKLTKRQALAGVPHCQDTASSLR
jgi:hypothetical protein